MTQRKVVVVVDDEPDICASIRAMLETDLGVDVRTAHDGKSGLAQLDGPADMLLSDYRMPGMNGLEMVAEAARRHPGLPTVMMSAYVDEGLRRRAHDEAGVRLFLGKPLDVDALLDVVRSLLLREGPSGHAPPRGS